MFAVFLSAMVVMAGQQSLVVLFPALGRQLHIADSVTALLTGLSAAVTIIMNPWWGARVQRFGVRPLLCLGLAGMALGSAVFAATLLGASVAGAGAVLLTIMVAVRILQPAAASAFTPAAFSYIAGATTGETRPRTISHYTAFVSLGSMAAMLGAALLARWNLAAPFVAVTFVSTAAVVLVFAAVRPDRVRGGPTPQAAAPAKLRLFDNHVWPWVLASMASGLMMSVWQLGTTFHAMDRFGKSPQEAAATVGSLFFVVYAIGFVFRMLVVPRLKLKPDILVVGSLVGIGLATLFLGFATSFAWLYPLFGVAGILFGVLTPAVSTRLSLSVAPNQQGLAGGLISSGGLVGVMAGSTLTGAAYPISATGMFGSAGAAVLLVAGAVILAQRREARLLQSV